MLQERSMIQCDQHILYIKIICNSFEESIQEGTRDISALPHWTHARSVPLLSSTGTGRDLLR